MSNDSEWKHRDNGAVAVHEYLDRHAIWLSELLNNHLMQTRKITGGAIVSVLLLDLDDL